MLHYWLCEKVQIVKPRKGVEDKTPRAVRWDLHNISKALEDINLSETEKS